MDFSIWGLFMSYVAISISIIGFLFNPLITLNIHRKITKEKNEKWIDWSIFTILFIVTILLFLLAIGFDGGILMYILMVVVFLDIILYIYSLLNALMDRRVYISFKHIVEILLPLVAVTSVLYVIFTSNIYVISNTGIQYRLILENQSIILFMSAILYITGISGIYFLLIIRHYLFLIYGEKQNKSTLSSLDIGDSSYFLALAIGLLVGLLTIVDRDLEQYSSIFRERYYQLVDIIKILISALVIPTIIDYIKIVKKNNIGDNQQQKEID